MLDHINFIETQAQVVIRELPRATLIQLPKLRSTGMPRIYALCSDYLEHVDGRYDVHTFESYLMSYQEVTVLKDAECWALLSAMRVIIISRLAEAMREVRKRHEVCHSITSLLEQIGQELCPMKRYGFYWNEKHAKNHWIQSRSSILSNI
ncbi:hypothetical protein NDK43_10405 [Neobacillus pocheonensis]|uniref:Uncharacterized protein n=1 Tax=Neobacillus pocheonensis TaxID=363869 RepID=A0ABT0WCF4_9BACI|nr:hypothetical protein [Neobacillus pocheonensis]